MYNTVVKYSKSINNDRTPQEVFISFTSEVGELATEVMAKYGISYKTSHEGAITEEAIDCIACLCDLIYLDNPEISEEEILYILRLKLDKWKKNSIAA